MTDQTQEAERSAEGTEAVNRGGAPKGNRNASAENRIWRATIKRALAQGANPDRLRLIAEKLLDKAEEGDLGAIKELGDRLDGKAAQQVTIDGDGDGGPVRVEVIKRVVVDPRAS